MRSRISINGLPAEVIDTAGLRDTTDPVEAMGIERTRAAIRDADLALVLVAGPSHSAVHRTFCSPSCRHVAAPDRAQQGGPAGGTARSDEQGLWVSAKTGTGLDLLTDAIADAVGF